MKLIALDVGTKRIGVAKADSSVRIAIPYSAVEVDGEEFKKIASLARAWDINNFVIGLPRNASGEETKQSLYVRQFAKALKKAIPTAKICFQDESLTSVEAENRLKSRKKNYKKGDIDSEAAAIILQDFLEEKTGKSTSRAAAAHRRSVKAKSSHRRHNWVAGVIALAILLVLAGAGAWWYYHLNLKAVTDDVDCDTTVADACSDVSFVVENGDSVSDVAAHLKEANLIRDSFVFQLYIRLNSGGESIKAGQYDFNQTMPVESIAKILFHGSDDVFRLTILPGENIMRIRQDLIDIGFTADEANAALSADYSDRDFAWVFEGRPEDSTSLEGYLYGDTYEFFRDDSAETIIARLIEEMAKVVRENNLKAKFAEHELSIYQGLTLASVVQREAGNPTDMAKVAQVFYNRLAQGMTMGSDVTAIYAVDLVDPDRVTYTTPGAVIEIDSAYNTRKYGGLPYGPICNPSIAALEAVVTPDSSMSDKLFFLTGDDQMMYYSNTDSEHQQNILEHCKELCNIDL